MYTEKYFYFKNIYGCKYENSQVRIGLDTAGNIRSFCQLYYNYYDECEGTENGGVQEPDMSLASCVKFLSSLNEEDSWYGKSSCEEFLGLALWSPPISFFPPQFEAGMKLLNP